MRGLRAEIREFGESSCVSTSGKRHRVCKESESNVHLVVDGLIMLLSRLAGRRKWRALLRIVMGLRLLFPTFVSEITNAGSEFRSPGISRSFFEAIGWFS